MKIISSNKQAFHEYFVVESLECGINLIGCEVKSLRNDGISLKDSFVYIKNGNIFLKNAYIKPYDKGSFSNVDCRRDRRLLAHNKEIERLKSKSLEKGYSIVPLKVYLKDALIKVEIALVKGKQLFDKREAIKRKDIERDTAREVRDAFKK